MTDSTTTLEFKSATIYTIRAVLHSDNIAAVIEDLNRRMQEAGSFFAGESVVIDTSEIETPIDWDSLLEAFSGHKLPVIGVVATGENASSAIEMGLTKVELSSTVPRATTAPKPAAEVAEPVQVATPMPAANAAQPEIVSGNAQQTPQDFGKPQPTLVIQGPLRSGQRVYARATDLIVMGVVSQGAEVIADGNIHVYGPLRGKAMAGARGDTQARIFTTALDAELVAVAGVYRVIDGPLNQQLRRQPAMIYLRDQTLRMEPLQA